MKKFAFPAALLAIVMASCTTAPMTEGEFESLKTRVQAATTIVSSRLAMEWDAPQRARAVEVITEARDLAEENNLGEITAGDVVRGLVERFGDKLGLDEQNKRDIRDVSLLIELATGAPIKIGPTSKLDPRDQQLVLAFLNGLLEGLK